jgi:hypothetical protein
MQPARVLAVAGLDYDRDGDIDLLVGTSAGALLWINNGNGAFTVLPVALSAGPPAASSSSVWTTGVSSAWSLLERNDRTILDPGRGGTHGLNQLDRLDRRPTAALRPIRFSQTRPRAPPLS